MKKILLSFVSTLLSLCVYSQSSLYSFADTITFEKGRNLIHIDTTQVNNIWQIGAPHKFFFDSAFSAPYAIVTDTIGSYAANNTSSFTIGMPYVNVYCEIVNFWYKIDTDSLSDGGYIEVSADTGKTWANISGLASCVGCNSIYNYGTITGGTPALTGKSNGWQKLSFIIDCQTFGGGNDSILMRFTFKSGALTSNKEGWMIDNLYAVGEICEGIDELKNQGASLSIYPNPAFTDVKLKYKLPPNAGSAELKLYDTFGYLLNTKNVNTESAFDIEDVSELPNGVYYYMLVVNGSVVATNKLAIIR